MRDILEVVRPAVRLWRTGREYAGLCPFHTEKTPSFVVNPGKGLWYCHGCHKGGDAITFVEILEGMSFREALDHLGEEGPPPRHRESLAMSDRLSDWRQEMSARIAERLRSIGARARMCRKVTRELPEADGELLGEEIERLGREWELLCAWQDSLFNPDGCLEMWRSRSEIGRTLEGF